MHPVPQVKPSVMILSWKRSGIKFWLCGAYIGRILCSLAIQTKPLPHQTVSSNTLYKRVPHLVLKRTVSFHHSLKTKYSIAHDPAAVLNTVLCNIQLCQHLQIFPGPQTHLRGLYSYASGWHSDCGRESWSTCSHYFHPLQCGQWLKVTILPFQCAVSRIF